MAAIRPNYVGLNKRLMGSKPAKEPLAARQSAAAVYVTLQTHRVAINRHLAETAHAVHQADADST